MKVHAVLKRGVVSAVVPSVLVVAAVGIVVVTNGKPKVAFTNAATVQASSTHQFTVPELGVVMTLPPGLANLNYSIDSTSVPGTTFAYFSTTDLQHLDDATTQCDPRQGPIGAIWKVNQDPRTIAGIEMSAFKQLGNSYLVFEAPQGSCTSNPATQQLELSQTDLLEQALSTATEAQ